MASAPKSPCAASCRFTAANPGRHEGHAIIRPHPRKQTRSAATTTTLDNYYHITAGANINQSKVRKGNMANRGELAVQK